jgi:Domain of unknown function (DUF4382)
VQLGSSNGRTKKEEGNLMRTSDRTIRKIAYLVFVLAISAALAACGGGGGTTSPGTSGPATVSVSMASATNFPEGTTTATSSPVTAAPPGNSPTFDHLFVTVTKLALIPSTGEGKSVTDAFGPVTIDLLNLNSSTGDNVATLLNKFDNVPAGEYSKIRVYYDNVVGQTSSDNTLFHPTANSHFDVHFMGDNLVIPVTSDPLGGIRFYSVEINVVGLKHVEAGNSGNFLLRPQVFAEVVGAPKYMVTGEAAQVDHEGMTFVVMAAVDNISVNYGSGTEWFYFDGRFVGPFVDPGADNALRDTAQVDVIGTFQGGELTAEEVRITFPDERTGTADNVWILDNTAFIVRSLSPNDNVTVFPMPDRLNAYFDNTSSPLPPLTFTAIDNGIQVKVRGYFNTYPDLDAYWISIEP